MKHILLLFIFIILFKLSLLFTPLNEGLWSLSSNFAIIGFSFFIYLLFQLKNMDITTKQKVYIILILAFMSFFAYSGWDNYYSIIKSKESLKAEINSLQNNNKLKNDIYNYLLITLNSYNKSNAKANLKTVFLDNIELLDKNAQYPKIKQDNKNLVILIGELTNNYITLYGVDTTTIGKLPGYKNFGNLGNGFVEFKATLSLGGINYERQN